MKGSFNLAITGKIREIKSLVVVYSLGGPPTLKELITALSESSLKYFILSIELPLGSKVQLYYNIDLSPWFLIVIQLLLLLILIYLYYCLLPYWAL